MIWWQGKKTKQKTSWSRVAKTFIVGGRGAALPIVQLINRSDNYVDLNIEINGELPILCNCAQLTNK